MSYNDKPYVVLRGIEHGNVFWTTTIKDDDPTLLADGTVAYEVIKYCDTDKEAMAIWDQHFTGELF
jgi:hypothetical protein